MSAPTYPLSQSRLVLHIPLKETDMCRIAAALLFAGALATPAEAQEMAVALSIYGPFGIDDLDGTLPVSAEFRFTVQLSDRFSLEPFVTVGSYRDRRSGPEGFYGAQVRQGLGRFRGKDVYPFVSYGASGYYSKSTSSAPIFGHLGFGLRQRLSEHLAFRPEVQLVTLHVLPIGARFVVGVSIAAGP
jgi:hypothetical protein